MGDSGTRRNLTAVSMVRARTDSGLQSRGFAAMGLCPRMAVDRGFV